jgi:hypothetical protein
VAAVTAAVKQVEDLCDQAGIRKDLPLRQILVTSMEQVDTARDMVQGARGLTQQGEAELVLRIQETVTEAIDAEARRIARQTATGLAIKTAVAGLVLLVSGFLAGRLIASDAQAEALEGAAFMAQIAEMNNAQALRDYCMAHRVEQKNGTACELVVWVKVPGK